MTVCDRRFVNRNGCPSFEKSKYNCSDPNGLLDVISNSFDAKMMLLSYLLPQEILLLSIVCSDMNRICKSRNNRFIFPRPLPYHSQSHIVSLSSLRYRIDWPFVTNLSIGDQWFRLPASCSLPNLTKATISHLHISKEGIISLANLLNTAAASLEQLCLVDLSPPPVESLTLFFQEIQAESFRRIASFSFLTLEGDGKAGNVAAAFSKKFPGLKKMHISPITEFSATGKLTSVFLGEFSGQIFDPRLIDLEIPGNCIPSCTSLKRAWMKFPGIDFKFPGLVKLNLIEKVSADFPNFSEIDEMPNLRELSVGGSRIPQDFPGNLKKKFPGLVSLHLALEDWEGEVFPVEKLRIDFTELSGNFIDDFPGKFLHLRSASHEKLRKALNSFRVAPENLEISSPFFPDFFGRAKCLSFSDLCRLKVRSLNISNLQLRDTWKSQDFKFPGQVVMFSESAPKFRRLQDAIDNIWMINHCTFLRFNYFRE